MKCSSSKDGKTQRIWSQSKLDTKCRKCRRTKDLYQKVGELDYICLSCLRQPMVSNNSLTGSQADIPYC